MSIKKIKPEKIQEITIQFRVTQEKYSDIQKLKANSGKVMMSNKDFYLYLMQLGMNTIKL